MEMSAVPSPSPSPTTRTTSTPKSSKVVLQAQEPVLPPLVEEDDLSNIPPSSSINSANSLPLPPTSQPNQKNVFQHFPMLGNMPYPPFISPQTGFVLPPSPTALRSSQMQGSITLPFPLLLPVPIPVPIPVFIPVPTTIMPARDNINKPVNQKGMLLKPFFRLKNISLLKKTKLK